MRAILLLALFPAAASAQSFTWGARNTDFPPAFPEQFRAELVTSDVSLTTEILAGPLEHPWGIAVLPDNAGYLVTERPGRLRHVAIDGTLSDPIAGVPDVVAERQGGLLDVTVSPAFFLDRTILLTYAKPMGGGMSATAAASAILSEDMTELTDVTDILVQEPPSPTPMHFGSRVIVGTDGSTFITTGEHSSRQERVLAQDLTTSYGKVIRLPAEEGSNPFVGRDDALDTIWSYGHRNIQGAAIAPDGQLWTIEHGPQGGDELNRPEAGLNYGWPVISYGQNYNGEEIGTGIAVQDGMEQPVYFWDPVIAPGGMMFHSGEMFGEWNGDLLIGSLYPGGVVRLSLNNAGQVVEEERLLRDQGRIRDVEVLADGSFLILTDFENGSVIRVSTD